MLPLSDPQADLETVGGKGMSLAKMVDAKLPVPDGFHMTTEAYRRFVAANKLQPWILSAFKDVEVNQRSTLEAASQAISHIFAGAAIPEEIGRAVKIAYKRLGPRTVDSEPSETVNGLQSYVSVAVRSSTTAEDLPGASFAG